jgi:hypothetical protein
MAHVGDSFHPARRFQSRASMSATRATATSGASTSEGIVSRRFRQLQGPRLGVEDTTAAAEALHGISKAVPGVET